MKIEDIIKRVKSATGPRFEEKNWRVWFGEVVCDLNQLDRKRILDIATETAGSKPYSIEVKEEGRKRGVRHQDAEFLGLYGKRRNALCFAYADEVLITGLSGCCHGYIEAYRTNSDARDIILTRVPFRIFPVAVKGKDEQYFIIDGAGCGLLSGYDLIAVSSEKDNFLRRMDSISFEEIFPEGRDREQAFYEKDIGDVLNRLSASFNLDLERTRELLKGQVEYKEPIGQTGYNLTGSLQKDALL